MKRRELAAFFGGLMMLRPRLLHAAESLIFRVGRIAATPLSSPGWIAFEQRLAELGYQEGRNLEVEFLEVGSEALDIPKTAAEFGRRNLDVIVAGGPEIALEIAMHTSRMIPIVMVAIDYDPLARGYIASLSRPGGNVTGVFLQQPELGAKRIELLKETIPQVTRAALFWDSISADQVQATTSAAALLGIAIDRLELRHAPYNYRDALSQGELNHADALVVLSSPIFFRERAELAEFALRQGLPSMSPFRQLTEAGGLISYGASVPGMYRRAAEYVDKLLKGAKPAELPVEQPTEFELILNLKTAKTLGVALPPSILARAAEVIE